MCNSKNKPHKHAGLIKAWADGATIQYFNSHLGWWCDTTKPAPRWYDDTEYRIKPEPVTDLEQYGAEAGDLWSIGRERLLFKFVVPEVGVDCIDLSDGEVCAFEWDWEDFRRGTLLFRRGVINRLSEV